jgi:hypothetical protein
MGQAKSQERMVEMYYFREDWKIERSLSTGGKGGEMTGDCGLGLETLLT